MRRITAAALGAGVSAAASAALRRRPPGGATRWDRRNFRGRSVSVLGGLAAACSSVAAGAVGAALTGPARGSASLGATLATAAAGAFGAVDDLDPDPASTRGLRGHVRALAAGRLTTGGLKLIGISGCAVVAALLLTDTGRRGDRPGPPVALRALDVLTSGALIAGTANLVNLFDLRPGRGLKATSMIAVPLTAVGGRTGTMAAAATGVVAGSWRSDLGEETMLGDTGANALGALVGSALAVHPRVVVRIASLGAVVFLIAASEKVSFSAVIADSPVLRAVDSWGRLP
ncbi:hypothetical protein [Ruania halotolerans]|uniref:hypothetical protein n=1 Tax=Ruania halotolerans TaxID=2897773 RepID=UPI001E631E17|nr:hypothetical protein [Ruania halotolerans]UFU05052.1 hypothetical protein LQF10_11250 [Ruania halotolerans]